ncbi:MAG: hypothetical protein M2R46_03166 [Verrucomicrobia subdivision 3 bacterium]|nr:hypothetical protein [Limisphaerales bacterium]
MQVCLRLASLSCDWRLIGMVKAGSCALALQNLAEWRKLLECESAGCFWGGICFKEGETFFIPLGYSRNRIGRGSWFERSCCMRSSRGYPLLSKNLIAGFVVIAFGRVAFQCSAASLAARERSLAGETKS